MSPPISTPSDKRPRSPRQRRWAWSAAGAAVALVGVLSAGLVVIEDGLFPATAITPHDPLTGWATHTAMIRSVRRDAATGTAAPSTVTPAEVAQGFRLYDQHCVMCHGGPGIARAGWTAGLTPTPPYLLDAARRWTPAELHVIVGDGIKMTAMPAWRLTLGERDTWSLVEFLEALPFISPERYRQLRAEAARTLGENPAAQDES